jgi:hypothetical protein
VSWVGFVVSWAGACAAAPNDPAPATATLAATSSRPSLRRKTRAFDPAEASLDASPRLTDSMANRPHEPSLVRLALALCRGWIGTNNRVTKEIEDFVAEIVERRAGDRQRERDEGAQEQFEPISADSQLTANCRTPERDCIISNGQLAPSPRKPLACVRVGELAAVDS